MNGDLMSQVYSHVEEERQPEKTDPDSNQFPHHRQNKPAKE